MRVEDSVTLLLRVGVRAWDKHPLLWDVTFVGTLHIDCIVCIICTYVCLYSLLFEQTPDGTTFTPSFNSRDGEPCAGGSKVPYSFKSNCILGPCIL